MEMKPETDARLSRAFRARLMSDLFNPMRVGRELSSAFLAWAPAVVVKVLSGGPNVAALLDDPWFRFMADYGAQAGVIGSAIMLLLASAKSLFPPALLLIAAVALSLVDLTGWGLAALAIATVGMLVNSVSPYQSA